MSIVSETVEYLREHGVELANAFTSAELDDLERRFGFRFGPDHRELLLTAVPTGGHWMDWRADEKRIRDRLDWPLHGMLFDVEHLSFWPKSWGTRPVPLAEKLSIALKAYAEWPKLVPLYTHRYMPAAPSESGAPVFSVYQTDVIYYGENLLAWARMEFGGAEQTGRGPDYLPPWSLLACAVDVP